ncbi:MAG: YecA family protein [Pseudomonadota bacterium]
MSLMEKTTAYSDVSEALALTNSEIGAAECHGMFCGVLCTNGKLNVEAMASQMVNGAGDDNNDKHSAANAIGALLGDTVEQLTSEDLDLRLLLPDDDESLSARSEALGLWCQGFVTGLSAGGVTADSKLSKDANELLLDFTNISRTLQDSESLSNAGGDEDEIAYAEVQEYVRVGVLLINEELRAVHPQGSVH